jgi:superfamily II DNA/RNA helicase
LALAEKLLNKPVRTTVGNTNQPVSTVKHVNVRVMSDKKQEQLLKEVKKRTGSILVFTRTKEGTEHLAEVLQRHGHAVDFLHGERSMRQRRQAISLFKSGERRILVATDIAARGLDIAGIEHVVNYHLPQSREDYIHRAGRTGRHGTFGNSVNFITPRDKNLLRKIGKVMGVTETDFQKGPSAK